MPALDKSEKSERTPIPVGRHILTLTECKPHESVNTFPDAKKVLNSEAGELEVPMRREFIWRFTSDQIDPKFNKPYEFSVFTSRFFNPTSSTNKLTLLMRQLAPNATDDEKVGMIETDSLIGRKWVSRLITATGRTGKEYTTYNSFEPVENGDGGVNFKALVAGPLSPAMKTALGNAMLNVPEETRGDYKAALLMDLGSAGYASYADFVARGSEDFARVMALTAKWAPPAPAEEMPI